MSGPARLTITHVSLKDVLYSAIPARASFALTFGAKAISGRVPQAQGVGSHEPHVVTVAPAGVEAMTTFTTPEPVAVQVLTK